jgi:lipoprotein-anchoring transpeptidase ErfK/SrfK
MIPSEQLVAALERLDPRDLEVLDLSMRRGVPDEALANVMGWERSEVARRRAGAIEHLADDLGVERGEDLGLVLKALLEPETWTAVDDKRWPAAKTDAPKDPATPAAKAAPEAAGRHKTWRALAIACAALAALAAAGAAGAVLLVDNSDGTKSSKKEVVTRRFSPQAAGPLAAPFPSSPDVSYQYLTVHLRRPALLYAEPGGRTKARLPAKTEWGSPRILRVLRQRGDWLAVLAPELKNGDIGWIQAGQGQLQTVAWSIDADLSRRVLVVKKDGHQVKRLRIAIGRKSNPTPKGQFAVTDKLRTSDGGPPYGCCVLALTGHQTRLPHDWPGGDRLAVHATNDTSGIGKPVSLGCMRVESAAARWLIETIPIGSPVTIRA